MDHKQHYVEILRSHQYIDREKFMEENFPEKSLKYMKVMNGQSRYYKRIKNSDLEIYEIGKIYRLPSHIAINGFLWEEVSYIDYLLQVANIRYPKGTEFYSLFNNQVRTSDGKFRYKTTDINYKIYSNDCLLYINTQWAETKTDSSVLNQKPIDKVTTNNFIETFKLLDYNIDEDFADKIIDVVELLEDTDGVVNIEKINELKSEWIKHGNMEVELNNGGVMTKEVALYILENHEKWRQGGDIPATNPKALTRAMNVAITILKHYINTGKILEDNDEVNNVVFEKPKEMIVSNNDDFYDGFITNVYGKFNGEYLTRNKNSQNSAVFFRYKYAEPLEKKKYTLKELMDKAGLNPDEVEIIK